MNNMCKFWGETQWERSLLRRRKIRKSYGDCTELVWKWYEIGTEMVRERWRTYTEMVRKRYRNGTEMVRKLLWMKNTRASEWQHIRLKTRCASMMQKEHGKHGLPITRRTNRNRTTNEYQWKARNKTTSKAPVETHLSACLCPMAYDLQGTPGKQLQDTWDTLPLHSQQQETVFIY